MRLKNFQVQNFKSILDSTVCYLPSNDGISILAGQNESGKSSLLQALYSFETGKLTDSDGLEVYPTITCTFDKQTEDLFDLILEDFELPFPLKPYFDDINDLEFKRTFTASDKNELTLTNLDSPSWLAIIKKHNDLAVMEQKKYQEYLDVKVAHGALVEQFDKMSDIEKSSPDGKKVNTERNDLEKKVAKLATDAIVKRYLTVDTFRASNRVSLTAFNLNKGKFAEEIKKLEIKIKDEDFEASEDEDTVNALIEQKKKDINALAKDYENKVSVFNQKLAEIQKTNGILEVLNEVSITKLKKDIPETLFRFLPLFIFFDDFCDLLPDSILIKDLISKNISAKGYQAVKNLETILKADFSTLDGLQDNIRERNQELYHEDITANFNERWKQKISENNEAKIHVKYNQGKAPNSAYLKFFINTEKTVYLTPAQRSQGFKWFLSFFLHLKAEDQRKGKLVILFDEPGLYLHSKAQGDMLKVFEELAEKNQIIYSTHSPYLIDSNKLHRVRLVINSEGTGTTINKITTSKIKTQPHAIKPVADAIGLDIARNFSLVNSKNVILEGLSDFHYFSALKHLLYPNDKYNFIPSMGSSNVHLIMELCIGWGLDWAIIFDKAGVEADYKKLKKNFFNDDASEADKKIMILASSGVEDMFEEADLQLVEARFKCSGENSKSVGDYGGKELFSRRFLDEVTTGKITKENLSKTAIDNFQLAFKFIKKALK